LYGRKKYASYRTTLLTISSKSYRLVLCCTYRKFVVILLEVSKMQTKMLTVLLTLIVFGYMSSITHGGTTYHVDADNQNIGDGSETNPFQTIEEGLEAATQGDKVLVHKVDGSLSSPRGIPTRWDHYLLSNSIIIEAGETLELEPGVVIKFKYYTNTDKNPSIIVDGCLRALGQPGGGENNVYFTSERDNLVGADSYDGHSPEAGDWYHIVFNSGSDNATCIIEHTEIRYAGRFWYDYWGWKSGSEEAILMNSASPTIRDTAIRYTYGDALKCDLVSSPMLQRLTFENNTINGLCLLGGTIHDQREWSNTDVVYYLESTVTIAAGSGSLTLPAGLVVKFAYVPQSDVNVSLIVNGSLMVLGTAEEPVILTSGRDDTANGDTNGDGPSTGDCGDWYHIVFDNDSDDATCIIEHAEICYAGRFWYDYWGWKSISEEAILMNSASPTIRDTAIRHTYGDALECDLASNPKLQCLTFENNMINGLNVLGGTIVDARAWSNTDIVYYLDDTVTVAAGAGSLTLPAGLVVKFHHYSNTDKNISLVVDGCLQVLGTIDQPVILTSIRDDSAGVADGTMGDTNNDGPSIPERGDWYHIVFNNSSDDETCIIEHTEIRYAGRFWYDHWGWKSQSEEAILVNSASPTIRETSFLYCWGYPVEMDLNSFPKMRGFKTQDLDSEDISAVHIVGGTMASSGTWSNPGIPYYLDDSVDVASGETLVIDPGTVVKFKIMDNIGLYFDRSKLNARQVADEPIVFTSIRDDDIAGDTNNDGPSDGSPGDWGQISLARTGRPNVGFRHAVFRYAGNGSGNAQIPALLLDFTDAEILNCSFEECSDIGIKLIGASTVDIRNMVSMRNSVGVHVTGGSYAAVTGWTSFQDQTALLVDNAEADVCNSILSYYSFVVPGGYGVHVVNNGSLNVSNSNVWSPWGTKYSTPPGDQTGVDNNISMNPGFADIFTDNLHLKSDSLCRDAGDDVNIVYHSDITMKGGTNDTVIIDPGTAANYVVSDWIEYNDDGALRRIMGIDIGLTEATLMITPLLSEPSQAGASIKDYGSGDMDLHPRISDSHVDMGAAEYNSLFLNSECFPKAHPTYAEWLNVGKPNCWCGLYATAARPRQCHGDADGISQGKNKYWISTNDLDILIAAWNKPFAEIESQTLYGIDLICADFDHRPQGKNAYRVSVKDLDILIANWQLTDGPDPDCP